MTILNDCSISSGQMRLTFHCMEQSISITTETGKEEPTCLVRNLCIQPRFSVWCGVTAPIIVEPFSIENRHERQDARHAEFMKHFIRKCYGKNDTVCIGINVLETVIIGKTVHLLISQPK